MRARKLDIADAGAPGCHFTAAEHFEVGGADDGGALHPEVGVGVAARMRCDDRLSVQFLDGELQQSVGIISGVATNRLDRQVETVEQGAKQRHGERAVLTIGGFSLLPKREFSFGVDDHMIAVAPEVNNFSGVAAREAGQHAETSRGITFGQALLVETITHGGF